MPLICYALTRMQYPFTTLLLDNFENLRHNLTHMIHVNMFHMSLTNLHWNRIMSQPQPHYIITLYTKLCRYASRSEVALYLVSEPRRQKCHQLAMVVKNSNLYSLNCIFRYLYHQYCPFTLYKPSHNFKLILSYLLVM